MQQPYASTSACYHIGMRILITGAEGQLGQSLRDTAPRGAEIIPTDLHNLNLCEGAALQTSLRNYSPDAILNAAAYTAVDKAENEPKLAYAVNCEAVRQLATYSADTGCRLIHVSTDFVFAGDATQAYRPEDRPNPASVYGQSKLAGERALGDIDCDARIVRTSWLYSEHGNNFVKTMLRLAREHDRLTVVNDQTGSPTYARNLANALWRLLTVWPDSPLLHYADAGETSWHAFAQAIFAEALQLELLATAPEVAPVSTLDYGAPAPRPAYSALDPSQLGGLLDIEPPAWRDALRNMLKNYADS